MRAQRMLARGRRKAESLMGEAVEIGWERRSKTLNETTGKYDVTFERVYAGPAKFKAATTSVRERDAQGQLLTKRDNELHLPVDASVGVGTGMVVRVLASATDPALVGVQARVKGPSVGSFTTARRFDVEVVT